MSEDPDKRVEIIPPGEDINAPGVWIASGSSQVRVLRVGPVGAALIALATALLLALGFVFLSGVFLILVPILALIAAGAWVSGLLGFGPRRLR